MLEVCNLSFDFTGMQFRNYLEFQKRLLNNIETDKDCEDSGGGLREFLHHEIKRKL